MYIILIIHIIFMSDSLKNKNSQIKKKFSRNAFIYRIRILVF